MKNSETLKIYADGEREVVIARVFDAPREMVFDSMTKPALVQRWLLGPPGWTMPICEIDLRVGGTFRYVWRKQGTDMGMSGVYREIVRPERLVHTEHFDDAWYPGDAVATSTFVEKDGKTWFTGRVQYESREARDGVLKSGMESGVKTSYDRLEEIFESSSGGARPKSK